MPEPRARRTFPGSPPVLPVAGFFLFIVAEVALLVFVATQIGWWTLVALMMTSLLGAYLLRREWRKAWQNLSQSVSTGRLPTGRSTDGALILLGGVFLVLPGFITDILGLLLVLPFTRPVLRAALGRWLENAVGGSAGFSSRLGGGSTVIEGEMVSDERGDVITGNVILPPAEDRDGRSH